MGRAVQTEGTADAKDLGCLQFDVFEEQQKGSHMTRDAMQKERDREMELGKQEPTGANKSCCLHFI